MHWQDLMQVVLSIKNGKISSSTLLRKLNNYSRKNRLYQAFREEFFRRLDQKTDWTNDEVKELFDEVVLWILNN